MDVQRDIGRHDAQIEALQDQVTRLHQDMTDVLAQLQEINKTLAEARGGWKAMVAVGGLASALTAVAMKAVHLLPDFK